MKQPSLPKDKKPDHKALKKLVGAVVLAGAAYAVDRIVDRRRNKQSSPHQKSK